MARYKNALRGHFIAPVTDPKTEPQKTDYLELAKWIEDISDDTDEQTTSTAYYDGDGTEETTVTAVKGSYTVKGTYDQEDKAMKHIATIRDLVINGISWFGCDIDPEKNVFGQYGDISTPDAKVRVLVIPTDEELVIARDVERFKK